MNIMVAVPAYRGNIHKNCVSSLWALQADLTASGVKARFHSLDVAEPYRARNAQACLAMEGGFTHLLFIDNDIEFQSRAVLRMISRKADVIGCVYPRRTEKPSFTVWLDGQNKLSVTDGISPVGGIGMGLCLISIDALHKLSNSVRSFGPDQRIGVKNLFGFFDPIRDKREILGEDYSFCKRWRDSGGTVFAVLDEPIGHFGETVYRANYLEHITKRQSPR